MSLPVVLTPEVGRDADQIREFLESERKGFGQVFLRQLGKTLSRISDFPKSYPVLKKNVRAVRIAQFLYVVYYRLHSDRAEVVAILHGRRDAPSWQARL